VLERALALHVRGPYVVQAAIASLHADEPRDWPQIAALYGELARLTDSPVVELTRAVAVAEEQGPEAGLEIVDRLALEDYHYLHSTRGELLRRLGRTAEARDAYRRALVLVHDDAEPDWRQIAALYDSLGRLTGSPVVELNRAVAVAEEQGPEAGLDIVDRLALEDYRYLHSTRGELLRRLGRTAEARDAYRRALALVHDDAERRLLERRLAELGTASGPARQ
jgi:predicted RNA polymerase sigma factor